MTDAECPCPRHYSWTTIAGALLTGATLGWSAAALALTHLR